MTRKKVGGGTSVKEKHVEDVWALTGCLRRDESIPRVLLKGGKRSREEWLRRREKVRCINAEGGAKLVQAASGINNELEEIDETRECAFKDRKLMQDENVAQEVATGGIDFNDQEVCTENNTAFHPVMIGDIMDLKRDVALL